MYKRTLILLSILIWQQTLFAQFDKLAFDITSSNKKVNLKIYENKNCDRHMILTYAGMKIHNNLLFNCCMCGGKIKESLDSVYLSNNMISIVQKTDDFKDSIVFFYLSEKKQYTLSSIYRTVWNRPDRKSVV